MHDANKWRGRQVALLLGWLAFGVPAWATTGEILHSSSAIAFQPVLHPVDWHRQHWHQRRRVDPSFSVELPWILFDPHFRWDHAPRPAGPAQPEVIRLQERGALWRDDVRGTGGGERLEIHPEGRILRSRPRSD
ncbi:MAG: hypothetical protein JJU25_17150 [Halomonas sp.]|nr:hypothetical protein [Halomonas sp.]MCC5884346.1 hypothetical protein [Halomonas sp.]